MGDPLLLLGGDWNSTSSLIVCCYLPGWEEEGCFVTASTWASLTPWSFGDVASLPVGSGKTLDSSLGLIWHYPTGEGEGCFLTAMWWWKYRLSWYHERGSHYTWWGWKPHFPTGPFFTPSWQDGYWILALFHPLEGRSLDSHLDFAGTSGGGATSLLCACVCARVCLCAMFGCCRAVIV